MLLSRCCSATALLELCIRHWPVASFLILFFQPKVNAFRRHSCEPSKDSLFASPGHTHTSLDKTMHYPYSGLQSGVFTPILPCLYFSDGEYGSGMWSEREVAQGMPWGKEEMLESISAPSCVRFSVLRQWGEGIESHVTSLRAVVNGDGAAWIGHSVKGQNRAVPPCLLKHTDLEDPPVKRVASLLQPAGWGRSHHTLIRGLLNEYANDVFITNQ